MTQPELRLPPPARRTDPETSHEAGAAVRVADGDIQRAIRLVMAGRVVPLTAPEIAERVDALYPDRWTLGTIVSATAPKRGSGLVVVDHTTNTRGSRVQLLRLL